MDSVRFMASFLEALVDNLTERLYKDKCKDCKASLEYVIAKDSSRTFKCMECDKSYDENVKEN